MYPMWKPQTKEGLRMLRLNRRNLRHLPPSKNPSSAAHWMEVARAWRCIGLAAVHMPKDWHENIENHARRCLSEARWLFLGRPGPAPREVLSVEEERQ